MDRFWLRDEVCLTSCFFGLGRGGADRDRDDVSTRLRHDQHLGNSSVSILCSFGIRGKAKINLLHDSLRLWSSESEGFLPILARRRRGTIQGGTSLIPGEEPDTCMPDSCVIFLMRDSRDSERNQIYEHYSTGHN